MKICTTSLLLKNILLHEKKPDIGNGVEPSEQKNCPEGSTRWPSTQYFRSNLQVIYQLACLPLPRMRCQKCPTSILLIRPWSDILLPDRRELLADYSLVQVMLNDQHPNNAGVIHFQPSDHFRGREAHADVTAEMLLSRTSSA